MSLPGAFVFAADFGSANTVPPPDATQEILGICTEVDRIVASAQLSGWASPSVQSDLGAIVNYQEQIAALVEQTPCSNDQQGDVKAIGTEITRLIHDAQSTGWATPEVQSQLGSIRDYTAQQAAIVQAPATQPGPPPLVYPFVCPVPHGGIFGQRKWYPGNGCDIFVPDNTILQAPTDCVIEEIIPGQGMSGGAEIILAALDRQWAWRWRHVQEPGYYVGQQISRGSALGRVHDDSLNLLGAIPAWAVQQAGEPFPSGWQHCDLSVNQGTDQFNPAGGSGGNVNGYQWLVENGYQGTVLGRTPGPPDAGFSLAQSVVLMTPAGRRADLGEPSSAPTP